MALITCSECSAQVSDKAEACPHCGAPIEKPASSKIRRPEVVSNAPQEVSAVLKKSNAPIFLSLAVIAFLLTLTTPRLLLFFPLMGTLGFAVISYFRNEKGRYGAALIFVLTLGLFALSEFGSSLQTQSLSANSTQPDAAEIVDWNWHKDPSFGTNGTIKWNVQVKNKSDQYLDRVKVELTTYDASNKLIATTSSYVTAIAPGQTRSENGYMDLYGTEETANLQIVDVVTAR
jgi:hypothetical protein